MDYKRLEKFDFRGLVFTVGCSIGALIASASMAIPFLVSIPLMPIAWILSFFTEHFGSIGDAIIVWYFLFTYFWASRFPFWTVRIVYFFGIINLAIAFACGAEYGVENQGMERGGL